MPSSTRERRTNSTKSSTSPNGTAGNTRASKQQVAKVNLTIEEYYKRYRHNENSLIHLRAHGTQPYTLPKLNTDRRRGRRDTTQREAIQLLPYQTFDLILPHCDTRAARKQPARTADRR